MFLDSVVRQVDKQVILVPQSVFLTRESAVSLPEVEALVLVRDQHPKSNVKLPLADEQGLLYVLLHHEDVRLHIALTRDVWVLTVHTGGRGGVLAQHALIQRVRGVLSLLWGDLAKRLHLGLCLAKRGELENEALEVLD